MGSRAGLGKGPDWQSAIEQALQQCGTGPCDLAFVFASPEYQDHYREVLAAVREAVAPAHLLGCSGQGVITTGREVEGEPAISVLCLSLPGARLAALRLRQEDTFSATTAEAWHRRTRLAPDGVGAWVILADPFSFDTEALLAALSVAYPGVPLVGGLASSAPGARRTRLFLDGHVHESGALLLGIGGGWTVRAVVSQGAEPIGETWTITAAQHNVIRGLGGRTPLEVLVDTLRDLPPELQQRASRNLLVGLAMDEYRDTFARGDFLIRNLVGVDQAAGAIAIGDRPRVGQTLQFQVRDAAAAADELDAMLEEAAGQLAGLEPAGALLCSCNGRGIGLFGAPDHDAGAIRQRFGDLPVAGFFCNGEIGPVGGKNFLHGFTASIAFFVPAPTAE
jgi:small ligand-binding sensory domain FIST